LGNLHNLCYLMLENNQLEYLPSEIGQLTGLLGSSGNGQTRSYACLFKYEDNPLISPPPEIQAQGKSAVLEYLRNQEPQQPQRSIDNNSAIEFGMLIVFGFGMLLIIGFGIRRGYSKSKRKQNVS